MAKNDVTSDWELSISGTSTASVQPGSGVEWMVTGVYSTVGNVTDVSIYVTSADSALSFALAAGETGAVVTADARYMPGTGMAKWMVSNSEYFRIRNDNSSSRTSAFSAIQTK